MKQFLFRLILISTLFAGCAKSETIEQNLVGSYSRLAYFCGGQPFIVGSFNQIVFNSDGTGYDLMNSGVCYYFNWSLDVPHSRIELIKNNQSTELVPYEFEADTLYLKRVTTVCNNYLVKYVKN